MAKHSRDKNHQKKETHSKAEKQAKKKEKQKQIHKWVFAKENALTKLPFLKYHILVKH